MTHRNELRVSGQKSWCRHLYRRIATCAVLSIAAIPAFPSSAEAQLGVPGSQIFQQGETGIPGAPAALEQLGRALETGDFDGDGFVDLAVGLPFEDVGANLDAGAANVLYSQGLLRDGFEAGGTGAWSAILP